MAKIENSVFGIFSKGMKLYFSNFFSFAKYMAFPVFGQIIGIILIFLASYFYTQHLQKTTTPEQMYNNIGSVFLILFLIILPGLLIFAKAFWDYLVAYGSVNSMLENLLKSGRVYDFPAHTQMITRRTGSFIALWFLAGILTIIGLIPLLWVIAGILFVYFILIFQVFTFEPDKSPIGCFKKSMTIIKGNFGKTLGLTMLLGIFTYWLLPLIVKYVLDFFYVIRFLAIPIDSWARQLPIDQLNSMLLKSSPTAYQVTSLDIAKSIVESSLSYIVVCFTLPFRSICYALWYKSLNKEEVKLDKRILKRAEAKEG